MFKLLPAVQHLGLGALRLGLGLGYMVKGESLPFPVLTLPFYSNHGDVQEM